MYGCDSRNRPTGYGYRIARRIQEAQAAGRPVLSGDQAWLDKAAKVPARQLFLPDMLGNTAAATFIACCSTIIYGTVGG